MLTIAPHPLLDAAAFTTELPAPLDAMPSPPWLVALLAPDVAGPAPRTEPLRQAIRDLLRHGGYRPTGRGKPSSEYLLRAAGEGALAPINLAVDACNAVSLHTGIPISVVDADRTVPPLRIAIAPEGASYVFNAAGQTIDLAGLLCLHDAEGPCANAVKDAQRTKTQGSTVRTLSVLWGTIRFEAATRRAAAWYRELLERAGARTRDAL